MIGGGVVWVQEEERGDSVGAGGGGEGGLVVGSVGTGGGGES